MRDSLAADLETVVGATRMALVSFGFALLSTLVSVLLNGAAQAVVQWIATLGFVVAWAAVNSGIYHRHFDWLDYACVKAAKWWATIFAPVVLINLVFAAANG
jgi:hypothetical protein